MIFKFTIKSLIFLVFLSTSAVAQERYILNNAQIITFENNFDPYLGHVIINNNLIEAVEAGIYKNETNTIKIIDCQKKYLLPGFIDSHTHTQSIPGMTIEQEKNEENKNIIKNYKQQMPKSYLYFGYTTILDLSLGDKNIQTAFNKGTDHPQLLISGGPIAEKEGYPLIYIENNNDFNIINSQSKNPNIQIDKAINRIVLNDGKVLKLFYEKGFGKNDQLPNLSKNNFRYIIKEAHKENIPVIIHANSLEAFKNTIDFKHDAYAHGLWRWSSEAKNSAELPNEVLNILHKILLNKIAYQPTTQVVHGLYLLYDNNFLDRHEVSKIITKNMIEWLKSEKNQVLAKEIKAGLTKEQAYHIFSNGQKTLNYIAKLNGHLLFGTDTPSAPIHTNLPGYNGFLEMLNWSKAGVTNKQILMAATINNAKFLKLENKIGSIAPNKTANLIILEHNPLENIENTNSIQKIILNGKIILRESLSVKN